MKVSISSPAKINLHLKILDKNSIYHEELGIINDNELIIDDNLPIHKGIYNRIVKNFNLKPLSFEMTTYSDAPAGSGLGTSSTLVVCIIKAFVDCTIMALLSYSIASGIQLTLTRVKC